MGTKTLLTAEDLERLEDDGMLYELDEGELISMPPEGFDHGSTDDNIYHHLSTFVREHKLGKLLPADTGFRVSSNPDTVLSPDIAFVRKSRVQQAKGFFPGAPDLAVEIFSPSDSVPRLMRKVRKYFNAGTLVVWAVFPDRREVHVMEPDSDRILTEDDILDCSSLLPGFSLPVRAIFEE